MATVVADQATLEQLPPGTLSLNVNVRADAHLTELFVESVRDHGVLTPVVAHRDQDGQVVVDQGQRRTLAAVMVGLDTIPVYVLPYAPDETSRIVDQLTENEHRAALGRPDLVAAVEQLALIGFTTEQIAKRVAIPRETAAAAAKVAGSQVATEYLQTMSLADAAVLVEFQDDPKAVAQLTEQAGRGWDLAAPAQRIRDEYAERDGIAAMKVELEAAGLTVVDRPGWNDKKTQGLDDLRTASGKSINRKQHAEKCPGHVVWIGHDYGGSGDLVAMPGCTGWANHGHTQAYGGSGKPAAADMSDEDRAQAAAERRHVIESNKDWKAATTVRRQWLHDFGQRKAAPSGAEQLIAHAVTERWANVDSYYPGGTSIWDLLGTTHEAIAGELKHAARGRALQISLVVCLASWEANLLGDAWRGSNERTARVLQAIAQWGHTLSVIEERVVDGTAAAPA